MEIPTTCKRSLYRLCNSTSSGTSSRQGGHHVAQKFRNTTLPCHSAVETTSPLMSRARNGGTACGFLANRMGGYRVFDRCDSPSRLEVCACVTSTSHGGQIRSTSGDPDRDPCKPGGHCQNENKNLVHCNSGCASIMPYARMPNNE